MMLNAWLPLFGCQLLGELIRTATGLPVPGPVIGLFTLAALLVLTAHRRSGALAAPLEDLAQPLIGHMGLLFVPAGVGIITETTLIAREWLPITAAVLGSTTMSVAITGAVMHFTSRASENAHG